jgi:hypothetical protein
VNNFIMKLSGRMPVASSAGIADCASIAPVLAFRPCTRDRIAATVRDGSGWNPTCMRVGKAL